MTSTFATAKRPPLTAGAAQTTGWVKAAGRIGIASRGVIYILLAYLAFDIARHGSAPAQTSSTGALEELAARTGGKFLLFVLVIGLGCYALWRLFEAVTGANGALKRASSLAVAIIYGILCVRAVELVAGHAAGGGASSNPEPWVAKIMSWQGGSTAIAIFGAGLFLAGIGLAAWGFTHNYEKNLALERVSRPWQTLAKFCGATGDLARGSLIALFGIYLIAAALTSNPAQAKSVDETLRDLVHHPFGAVAIGAIAVGLLFYGLFSSFDARLRRL